MNDDYAHLLGRKIDFEAFGVVLSAIMAARGDSNKAVGRLCGIAGNTVSSAAGGGRVDANSYMALCIYTGADPFAAMEPDPLGKGVSQETGTCAVCETGGADG